MNSITLTYVQIFSSYPYVALQNPYLLVVNDMQVLLLFPLLTLGCRR
jgi:hypothetical protein